MWPPTLIGAAKVKLNVLVYCFRIWIQTTKSPYDKGCPILLSTGTEEQHCYKTDWWEKEQKHTTQTWTFSSMKIITKSKHRTHASFSIDHQHKNGCRKEVWNKQTFDWQVSKMFYKGGDHVITINSVWSGLQKLRAKPNGYKYYKRKIAESMCEMYWVQVLVYCKISEHVILSDTIVCVVCCTSVRITSPYQEIQVLRTHSNVRTQSLVL